MPARVDVNDGAAERAHQRHKESGDGELKLGGCSPYAVGDTEDHAETDCPNASDRRLGPSASKYGTTRSHNEQTDQNDMVAEWCGCNRYCRRKSEGECAELIRR